MRSPLGAHRLSLRKSFGDRGAVYTLFIWRSKRLMDSKVCLLVEFSEDYRGAVKVTMKLNFVAPSVGNFCAPPLEESLFQKAADPLSFSSIIEI